MDKIFEQPIILEGEKGNSVLIYSEYIISDITQELAELTVERIDKKIFNSSEIESIIKINEILEYEFEKNNDNSIMFGCKDEDLTTYKNVYFKDAETTIKAENLIQEQFRSLGFQRKEEQMSAMSAAITPLVISAVVGVLGSLLTWFAYEMQDYEPTRTKVVKWYVYLIYKISKVAGHMPFVILTVILVVLCLIWTVRRMLNPPFKISAEKKLDVAN